MARVLLPCAVALALAAFAPGLVGARAADEDPPKVTWGGREFRSDADLARWLRARGASYYRWATRHPSASTELERGTPSGVDVVDPGVSAVAPSDPFVTGRTAGVLGAVALALVLLLGALAPERVVARGPFSFVADHRFEIAALAVVIGAGAALTVSL